MTNRCVLVDLDRVIVVATRLFAQLGYDSTEMRLIADSLGISIANLTQLAGTKRELYVAVMRRVYDAERDAVAPAITALPLSPDGVLGLADRYLDFCVSHPELPALSMHRWMADAADVTDLEEVYMRRNIELIRRALEDSIADGLDVDYVMWTVVWCVYGFLIGGVRTDPGSRGHTPAPAEIAAFRAHLHLLVGRMLKTRP